MELRGGGATGGREGGVRGKAGTEVEVEGAHDGGAGADDAEVDFKSVRWEIGSAKSARGGRRGRDAVHSCQCIADAYPCDVVGEGFP